MRRSRGRIGAALSWTIGLVALIAFAVPPAAAAEVAFESLASELLDRMAVPAAPIEAARKPERLRIAIWPFSPDEIPVSPELAHGYNDRLLRRCWIRQRTALSSRAARSCAP